MMQNVIEEKEKIYCLNCAAEISSRGDSRRNFWHMATQEKTVQNKNNANLTKNRNL